MKKCTKYILQFSFCLSIIFCLQVAAQSNYERKRKPKSLSAQTLQLLYVAHPNHRELVLKSFELALNAGFSDTSGISTQEIRDRLEAGAYSEDFESIPGIIGEHFPAPWNQGPTFDFNGLYPFSKIPYGNYTDTLSGWYRGLNHGFDPLQGFIWPGADATTVEWANYLQNSFIWTNAIALYESGNKAKAYECIGHILHLLADLSVPSHIKVVDHGISINRINSGTIFDPDLMDLIIDEYEMSLSGGLSIPGLVIFPDLLSQFRSSLNSSNVSNIPDLNDWGDYLQELSELTYNYSIVNQYYTAPVQNGGWGSALNENGIITAPTQYGITPPVELNGRWVQIALKSTAGTNGTILPEADMISMCNYLVPKAVEYGAGLLIHFNDLVTDVDDEPLGVPFSFRLEQNYPNPFNPSTKISWQSPVGSWQTLKIYDVLGNEVATLVDEYKPAGTYEAEWNSSGLPSGVYFYKLQAGDFVKIKKMLLLK